jgi:MFS family permease
LITPFDATPASIGLVISVFTAPSIVMIPIAGVIADQIGRKQILGGSLLVFGLAGTAIIATTDFRIVLALRTIQGIAFGGLTPIIITSIGDLYSGTKEATAQGLRFTGSGLSLTIFPLLAGVLVTVAWQYPFLIHLIAFPIALAVLLWYDEAEGIEGTSKEISAGTYRQRLLQLLQEPRVIAMITARGLGTIVWTGFLTYNSLIVVRIIGGTTGGAGLLVSLGSVFFAVTSSQAGRVTDIFDSRMYPLIAANGFLGIGMSLLLFAPSLVVAIGGIVVLGTGFGIALSLYRSIITSLAPQSLRGGVVSISEAAGRIMDTLTPIAMGGVIGTLTPVLGLAPAVRIAGLSAAIIGAGGGCVCLVVLRAARPTNSHQYT